MNRLVTILVLLFVCCGDNPTAPDCPEDRVLNCNYKKFITNTRLSAPVIASYVFNQEDLLVTHVMVMLGGHARNLNEIPVSLVVRCDFWFEDPERPPGTPDIRGVGELCQQIIAHQEYGLPYLEVWGKMETLPPFTQDGAPIPGGSYWWLVASDLTSMFGGLPVGDLPRTIYYEYWPYIETEIPPDGQPVCIGGTLSVEAL